MKYEVVMKLVRAVPVIHYINFSVDSIKPDCFVDINNTLFINNQILYEAIHVSIYLCHLILKDTTKFTN